MQSAQEAVLEEFMQRSFGAQFLFVPKKYRKGTAQREPADLAWVSDDLVVLFYMTSSASDIKSQTEHNLRQAKGYRRIWATGRPTYALRGVNRFGDSCFVHFKTVRILLTVLVVRGQCGIHVHPIDASSVPGATLTIPEHLIHWTASFGGTIVDLLQIVCAYCQDQSTFPDNDTERFNLLGATVDAYVRQSISRADPAGDYLNGGAPTNYSFMYEHLANMRLPSHWGRAVSSTEARARIARVFGDLSLVEYASVTAAAEHAIQASEPPHFRKWVVLKISGLYYSFVVWTVNMNSSNVLEVTNAALEACKNASGVVDCISIQYGNVLDANEFRVPLMLALPPSLPMSHAMLLAERILGFAHKLPK